MLPVLWTARKRTLKLVEYILLHFRLGDLNKQIWFRIAPNSTVDILLAESFIDRFVRSIIQTKQKVAPWHSRPAAVMSRRSKRWDTQTIGRKSTTNGNTTTRQAPKRRVCSRISLYHAQIFHTTPSIIVKIPSIDLLTIEKTVIGIVLLGPHRQRRIGLFTVERILYLREQVLKQSGLSNQAYCYNTNLDTNNLDSRYPHRKLNMFLKRNPKEDI